MEQYKILKDLISFNTIKDLENKKIINYIENYLKKIGFQTEYKDKSLIMSIGNKPKIGFLGHTDTVNYSSSWNTNPFKLTKIDNKLYGLGICDMKGSIAALLEVVHEIDFQKLKYGMKLYFTYDEEISFNGIYDILKKSSEFPDVMIFGEPTNNQILVGSKGILDCELSFVGKKVHSSNPEKGKNAIMNAVKFLYELEEFYLKKIKVDIDDKYENPYTTMCVGIIKGGIEVNSVSENCLVSIDFRIIKKKHIKMLKDKINNLAKKYSCQVKIYGEIEPFISKNKFIDKIKTTDFITEASFIPNVDKLILGLGPVNPHETNEYIEEESYLKLIDQYKNLIIKCCK